MASTLKIHAVRLRPDEHARLADLLDRARAKTGLPTLGHADLIRLALPLLDREYPPAGEQSPKKNRQKSDG